MARLFSSMVAVAVATSVALVGCVGDPADAQTRRGVSAKDKQIGAQEHPKILAEFGGPYSGPAADYVTRVGSRVAVQSGIAATPGECTVTLLNTHVVNAFAIPGCYVYVTRGLLSIMNDEAELASVLGHEIGHVAARHSQRRQSTSTLGGLGAVLVGILTGSGQLAQLAGQAAQLYTLQFSRSQELESDDLGIRYMTALGYDPYASADMLESLEDESALQTRIRGRDEAARIPAWARTHPLTAERVSRATARARQTGIAPNTRPRYQPQYMAAVDGLLFGDDPSQGYVEGNRFAHPTLRISFQMPNGFFLNNGTTAVTGDGPNGIRAMFSGGNMPANASLDQYVGQVWQSLVGQQVGGARISETTINGFQSAVSTARVPTQGGATDVNIVAYRASPTQAYHFIFLSPSNVNASSVVESTARSFRRLSDSEVAALKPRRIDVVTVRPGDTIASLASRMAFNDFKTERFLMLNDREANQPLKPGEQVKIIVYGR